MQYLWPRNIKQIKRIVSNTYIVVKIQLLFEASRTIFRTQFGTPNLDSTSYVSEHVTVLYNHLHFLNLKERIYIVHSFAISFNENHFVRRLH